MSNDTGTCSGSHGRKKEVFGYIWIHNLFYIYHLPTSYIMPSQLQRLHQDETQYIISQSLMYCYDMLHFIFEEFAGKRKDK